MSNPLDRVLSRCEVGDCWRWQGSHNSHGYGYIRHDGSMQRVHRLVWEALIGPIPDGLTVDHLCFVRDCVNPDHLRIVTMGENTQSSPKWRASMKYRYGGLCRDGLHEMVGDNAVVRNTGKRYCRACRNVKQRLYRKTRANE